MSLDRQDHGAVVFTFPRTMSLGNWPFLVLLFVIALATSSLFIVDGQWLRVAMMFGGIFVLPLLWMIFQPLSEVAGKPDVDAIHENGIVWRAGRERGFVPWADIAQLERIDRDVDGVTFTSWLIHQRANTKPIELKDVVKAARGAEYIAARVVR